MMKITYVVVHLTLLISCRTDDVMSPDENEIPKEDQNLENSGAEYLQNVMNQLQSEKSEGHPIEMMELTNLFNTERVSESIPENGKLNTAAPNYVIAGPTPVPTTQAEIHSAVAPPPALTNEELVAIYEAAVTKASTLNQLQAAGTKPISQFHHPPPPVPQGGSSAKPAAQITASGTLPGYYYYFYPIKSFTKTPSDSSISPATGSPYSSTSPGPTPITITMTEPPNNRMEPLFMAISGFIGMAVMFIFSVLFLPKFGKFRSDDFSKLKEAPDDLAAFGRLVIEAIDGKDCSERMACEIGRILKRMRMDDKPLRILEILLPPPLAKQITQVRKSASRKEKCNFIPCKYKTSDPPIKNSKHKWKKDTNKGQTAHDLWMKNFEKEKLSFKQPENIWKQNSSKIR